MNPTNSGSLAMLVAMRRASSRVSRLVACVRGAEDPSQQLAKDRQRLE